MLLPAATAIAQPAPRLDAAGFLPPTPGTTWVYEIHRDGATRVVTKRITRVLRVDGAPCVEISVQEGIVPGPISGYEHYALLREGVVQIGRLKQQPATPGLQDTQHRSLWLAAPVGLNPAWDVGVPQGAPRAALQGIGEVVEVPAGRFACARVEYSPPDPASKLLFEYAPGVCVVRDQWTHNGKVVQQTQLREFRAGSVIPETTPAEVAVALATGDAGIVELTHPYFGRQYESRFFRIGISEQAQLARSFRGRVVRFALDSGASWRELLDDEGFIKGPGAVAVLPQQNSIWHTTLGAPPMTAALLDVLLCQPDLPDDARVTPERLQSSVGADPGRLLRIAADVRVGTHTRKVQIEAASGRIQSVMIQR